MDEHKSLRTVLPDGILVDKGPVKGGPDGVAHDGQRVDEMVKCLEGVVGLQVLVSCDFVGKVN